MSPYLYQLHDREAVHCTRHDYVDPDGRGYGVEWGEYMTQCCQDGAAICVTCGGLAHRDTDNGPKCDPCHYEWEREFAS